MTHCEFAVIHKLNPFPDPADFSGQSDVLVTFSPDETEQYVNVSVVNDEILEGNEMFTATLTSNDSTVINGSNNTATATIIDTDSKLSGNGTVHRDQQLCTLKETDLFIDIRKFTK